jgi:hypothetical protein
MNARWHLTRNQRGLSCSNRPERTPIPRGAQPEFCYHGYFGIDDSILFTTIDQDLKFMLPRLEALARAHGVVPSGRYPKGE